MKILFKYFISGLVFLIPIILFYQIAKSATSLIGGLIPSSNSFVLVLTFLSIALLGFLTSSFLGSWIRKLIVRFSGTEGVIANLFKVAVHYEDVSKKAKKAFTKPVYVNISDGIRQIGFITDEDVSLVKNSDESKNKKIAVYVPQPVTFMGDLIFVDNDKLEIIPESEAKKTSLYLFTAGILKK
ncbi:DUF502 domain-containing protein [Patescibacteria group bacterium]